MKSLRPTGGYTILEVMIVLAISGGLLVSAMTLISGQQRKTEFTTAARDFENKLQDVFNDVGSGYYPNNSQLMCDNNLPSYDGPDINAGAAQQGTNEECVFLGKALRFYGNPLINFDVLTIAGRRQYLDGPIVRDVTDLSKASPTLFFRTDNDSAWDTGTINNGLRLSKIRFGDVTTGVFVEDREAVAILSAFTDATSGNGVDKGTVAGSDGRAYLASINPSSGFNTSRPDFKLSLMPMQSYPAVIFCLNDGPTANDRQAAVGVGVRLDTANIMRASGNRLSTELFLDNQAAAVGCTP